MKKHFTIIEVKLEKILSTLDKTFSQNEKEEVRDFIGVGEYGLAMSTLIDIINEEKKNISKEVYDLLEELEKIMKNYSQFT
jgi:uncharacterized protein with HEPN domain